MKTVQSWRVRGYTQMPNLLMSKALPGNVRLTAMALYARGFGGKQGVCLTTATIAKDVGFSRQTVQKHLNVLEVAGLIKRIRRGQRMANVIILTLKARAAKLGDSIERSLRDVREVVLNGGRRSMGWWVERCRVGKEARRNIGAAGWRLAG